MAKYERWGSIPPERRAAALEEVRRVLEEGKAESLSMTDAAGVEEHFRRVMQRFQDAILGAFEKETEVETAAVAQGDKTTGDPEV